MDLLSPEFTLDYFQKNIRRVRRSPIKVVLLNQKLFPGMGNYLASEVCALAGILPTKMCDKLTQAEIDSLFQSIPKILHGAIKAGGVTFAGGYQDALGQKGGGKHALLVFHQKICRQCKTSEVIKIVLAGRGTFYCPRCQT